MNFKMIFSLTWSSDNPLMGTFALFSLPFILYLVILLYNLMLFYAGDFVFFGVNGNFCFIFTSISSLSCNFII
jgi:hypothetical protein